MPYVPFYNAYFFKQPRTKNHSNDNNNCSYCSSVQNFETKTETDIKVVEITINAIRKSLEDLIK